jgi:zinc protease
VIPVIERDTVDGVRVLRSASVTGRTTAALMFRVGRFDESVPSGGITHLVEHLTLSGRPRAAYEFNAEVSGRFTTFLAESGDPEDIADFLATVARGLTLDYRDSLEREKRVVRTEAASRGGAGAVGVALGKRYGATGPGLLRYEEFGLDRLDWAEIDAWRRHWFVAGNAVLWIHGPPPRDLRIGLPPGPPRPMAPLRPVGLDLPGFIEAGRGGIGLSMVSPQSRAASVALDILRERLTRVLRFEHGLSYGVELAGELLDAELAHSWLAADALPEQQPMVAHTMLTTIESFLDDGSSPEEIGTYARRLRDRYAAPSAPAVMMQGQAQDLLLGRPARDPGQVSREVSQLGREQISAAGRDLAAGMIVVTPTYLPVVQGRMPRLPAWSRQTVAGPTATSADGSLTLTFGPEGTMVTTMKGQHLTVPAAAVAALLYWTDGQRALLGADGVLLVLDPEQWPDGAAVVRAIEAGVDPRLRVPLDRPGPPRRRPAPAPAPAAAPARPAAQPRPAAPAPARRRRLYAWQRTMAVLLAGIAVAGVGMIGRGDTLPGVIVAVLGLGGVLGFRLILERRARSRAPGPARSGPN